MENQHPVSTIKRLAIIGGGPSALFLVRRMVDQEAHDFTITIFERKQELGVGLPYSADGSGDEHVTNVSGNEIPELMDSLTDWIKALPEETLHRYDINRDSFSDYKVVPRLLFGQFLKDQFEKYLAKAAQLGLHITLHLNTLVTEIEDRKEENKIAVITSDETENEFDTVVICSGHRWPRKEEGRIDRHFDSPYPPQKLKILIDQPVHIRGCSLTAIDAVRTIARENGEFIRGEKGNLRFETRKDRPAFRLAMRSRHAILPGLRFHLEDPHLSRRSLLSKTDFEKHRQQNNGFISLDYIFDCNFKDRFKEADTKFYQLIKDFSLEEFIAIAMSSFSDADPFVLFAGEYAASLQSIKEGKSEYWKEKLAILSVAMNYPAKYLSAEDMKRFREHLMPLISIVIAFVPQSSAEELLALHAAGKLSLTKSDEDDEQIENAAFVDCTGQPHLWLKDFPFQGLVKSGSVRQARLRHKNRDELSDVPGLDITDHFQAVGIDGKPSPGLFIMAVPYIGGFNPDYSGLDFCDDASKAIVEHLMK